MCYVKFVPSHSSNSIPPKIEASGLKLEFDQAGFHSYIFSTNYVFILSFL